MALKTQNPEEKMTELLEKILIIQLYVNGANRDQIKEVVGIGSEKVSQVIKYIKQKHEGKNG